MFSCCETLKWFLSFCTDDTELSSSSRSSSPEPGCVSPSVRDAINQEVRWTNHCHHYHCQCFYLLLVLCRMDQDSFSLAQLGCFLPPCFFLPCWATLSRLYELKFCLFLMSSAILIVLRAKFNSFSVVFWSSKCFSQFCRLDTCTLASLKSTLKVSAWSCMHAISLLPVAFFVRRN